MRPPIKHWFWEWWENGGVKAAIDERMSYQPARNTLGFRESLELAYRAGFKQGRFVGRNETHELYNEAAADD